MSPKIFLAEDDNDDSSMFEEALSEIFPSFQMHRVHDGLECIYALKNFLLPDYIILDLNMPLKNGIDCLKAIATMPDLAEVPVVIYSTNHQMKDIDMAYKLGAAYYLVKPTSQQKLVKVLRRLFLLLKQPGFSRVLKHSFVIRDIQKETSDH
ncbi:response regulator [Aridibaculum aurantiacum]|uniref:response regulator n=1 Tax=Aridibaculum aurantiacum TaxID=2810307 RepID=UPI001A96ED75|nr:response regulator [Aridibaculum aurantiacum]